jgi:DNA recombination protein RmuC
VLGDHWAGVGKNLNDAVSAYNKSVATLESRVLVTARKFQALEVTGDDKKIRDLVPIEAQTRAVQAIELLPGDPDRLTS